MPACPPGAMGTGLDHHSSWDEPEPDGRTQQAGANQNAECFHCLLYIVYTYIFNYFQNVSCFHENWTSNTSEPPAANWLLGCELLFLTNVGRLAPPTAPEEWKCAENVEHLPGWCVSTLRLNSSFLRGTVLGKPRFCIAPHRNGADFIVCLFFFKRAAMFLPPPALQAHK